MFKLLLILLVSLLISVSENIENCQISAILSCDLPEFSSCEQFQKLFWDQQHPAVIRKANLPKNLLNDFENFRLMTTRESLSSNQLHITLSTSVSYTGRVFIETTVDKYVQDNSSVSPLGNETFYLFGNHEGDDWKEFLSHYPRLESTIFSCLGLKSEMSTLSFGCAKSGTGVPWHFHGPGFLQVVNGAKTWFLAPPKTSNSQIRFDPNITTGVWYEREYLQNSGLQEIITRCDLNEGDIIYFPNMWHHATYNTEKWNSWVSTFL